MTYPLSSFSSGLIANSCIGKMELRRGVRISLHEPRGARLRILLDTSRMLMRIQLGALPTLRSDF